MPSVDLFGNVDVLKESEILGWAADLANRQQQVFVDIVVNSTPVASVLGCLFREDLLVAGIGDGRKCFRFDPLPYLDSGNNVVEVRYGGSMIGLPGGKGQLVGISQDIRATLDQSRLQQLTAMSQERWKGAESDPGLTWGEIFTGDSFVDALLKLYTFSPDHHICEIGPGYGRLLKTILGRGLPFRKYTGVELSPDRVRKLNAEFGSDLIQFVEADVAAVRLSPPCDLVFCSSTFEHLFPDCTVAVKNLVENNLVAEAWLAIDFIQSDTAMSRQSQFFEEIGHAFVRTYSATELKLIFLDCGLTSPELDSIVLGSSAYGDIRRIFALARKPSR
jgi:phospholipid N-methyltransferase